VGGITYLEAVESRVKDDLIYPVYPDPPLNSVQGHNIVLQKRVNICRAQGARILAIQMLAKELTGARGAGIRFQWCACAARTGGPDGTTGCGFTKGDRRLPLMLCFDSGKR